MNGWGTDRVGKLSHKWRGDRSLCGRTRMGQVTPQGVADPVCPRCRKASAQQPLTVRLDPEAAAIVRALAEAQKVSPRDWISTAIRKVWTRLQEQRQQQEEAQR